MQLLTAIMRPFLIERVTRALRAENIPHYITKIVGANKESPENSIQHVSDMMKLELPINDSEAVKIAELIKLATTHHEVSDAVVWTVPMLHYESGDS